MKDVLRYVLASLWSWLLLGYLIMILMKGSIINIIRVISEETAGIANDVFAFLPEEYRALGLIAVILIGLLSLMYYLKLSQKKKD